MKDRILTLMKRMGMSQKTFAAEICISEGALSSIFNGRTNPTLNTVNNIHERFPEVNIGWLMDGKGEMFVAGASAPTGTDANAEAPTLPFPSQYGMPAQPSGAEPNSVPQQAVPQAALSPDNWKIADKPMRRISEIRVFYDDGTFEVFPAPSGATKLT